MTTEKHIFADLFNFDKAQKLIEAVLSGKYRVIIYGGAIRGGKTFNALLAMLLLMRRYPGSRVAIVRQTFETLRRNTLPSCEKVFCEPVMKLTNATSYTWEMDNIGRYGHERNSQAFFFAEAYDKDKDLRRWDGLEVNFFMLDQIEELTEQAFNKAIERAGAYVIPGVPLDEQPKPLIVGTVNPCKAWPRRVIYDAYVNDTLPDGWLYIPSSILDNPHISEEYKESLEQLRFRDPSEYERRVLGSWDYTEEDLELFTTGGVRDTFSNDFIPGGEKYLSCDIALQGSDKFIIGVWNGFRCELIITIDKCEADEVEKKIKEVANRYNVRRSNIVYDSDGVGAFLRGYLANARPFVNNSRAIEKENYENLKTQCYYDLARMVESGEIYIAAKPKVQDLIEEELTAIQRRDIDKEGKLKITRKEDIKAIIGRSPDYADMLAMRMVFEKKPPAVHIPKTIYIKKRQPRSRYAQELSSRERFQEAGRERGRRR